MRYKEIIGDFRVLISLVHRANIPHNIINRQPYSTVHNSCNLITVANGKVNAPRMQGERRSS